MVNKVAAQRTCRAARGGIFADVHAHKKSRVRASFANLDRLARERIAACSATEYFVTFEDFVKQILVGPAMTKIRQRADRNQQHRVPG